MKKQLLASIITFGLIIASPSLLNAQKEDSGNPPQDKSSSDKMSDNQTSTDKKKAKKEKKDKKNKDKMSDSSSQTTK